jgi:hypothetical protein
MNKRDRAPEPFGVNILKLPGAAETLMNALAEGSVTPAVLLESLYYASDESLFSMMRIVAALDENERAKVLDYARALQGDEFALKLLLDLPDRRDSTGRREDELDTVSGQEDS